MKPGDRLNLMKELTETRYEATKKAKPETKKVTKPKAEKKKK